MLALLGVTGKNGREKVELLEFYQSNLLKK
jgi:hypothetical protein